MKDRILGYTLLASDLLEEDVNTGVSPTPEEVTEYLKGCTSSHLPYIINYFHRRYPNEDVWPPGTVLTIGLKYLYLEGGTLPPGTVLPERLEYLYLECS